MKIVATTKSRPDPNDEGRYIETTLGELKRVGFVAREYVYYAERRGIQDEDFVSMTRDLAEEWGVCYAEVE